ncbi:Uncharacterized protein Adt_33241 [Abeliophyllum distichum]|uniref:Reverse transcriptase domain-containing protein n=1 Tax=Abeliophyllum distichum TaxID=126358 RepID=A0ABD1QVP0_9LAMI
MEYGAEAMIPVEIGISSPRYLHFDEVTNENLRRANMDLQDERYVDSQLRLVVYQRKMARYYNSKVKGRNFHINDFVQKKVFQANREGRAGTLGPTWNRPYKIIEKIWPGTTDWKIRKEERRGTPRTSLIYDCIISSFHFPFLSFPALFLASLDATLF